MKGTSRIHQTSPGKNVIFPSIYLLHLPCITFGRKDFVLLCKLIQWYLSLVWSSYSSDRKFAARFLQIPRHRGHPCVKLTTTSAFVARDFHPRDYTHAGRTIKNARPDSGRAWLLLDIQQRNENPQTKKPVLNRRAYTLTRKRLPKPVSPKQNPETEKFFHFRVRTNICYARET